MQGPQASTSAQAKTLRREKSLAEMKAERDAINREYDLAVAKAARQASLEDQAGAKVLLGRSPSPKKRKQFDGPGRPPPAKRHLVSKDSILTGQDLLTANNARKPSSFLTTLTATRTHVRNAEERRQQTHTTGFSHRRQTAEQDKEASDDSDDPGPAAFADRDDDLALVEKLEPGPIDFVAPTGDPNFELVEPYSKIRLKKRLLAHDLFQDHMAARYYVSPSMLYSIVRPGRGTDLEVPVDGDWVVIGVLSEKSSIKMTAGPQKPAQKKKKKKKVTKGDEDLPDEVKDDADLKSASESNEEDRPFPNKRKRYLMFKLVDMRLRRGSSTVAGDSVLSVALFESDSSSVIYEAASSDEEMAQTGVITRKDKSELKGQRKKETFTGGSNGAYEKFWKEQNGTVVAIMNPKVMKPRPNPANPNAANCLSITPDNADSIIILGTALDMATCQATRKDGQPCTAFCDKRVNTVCDFHVQLAIQKRRSSRSELMTGTSSLTAHVGRNKKKQFSGGAASTPAYDPVNKIGLLPNTNKSSVYGLATYVAGSANAGSRHRPLPQQPATASRREKEDSEQKRQREENADKMLRKVLRRDGGKSTGGKYLSRARAAISEQKDEPDSTDEDSASPAERGRSKAFGPTKIKALGCDPSRRDQKLMAEEDEEAKARRAQLIASLDIGKAGYKPKLAHAPNARKSNVIDPDAPSSDPDELVVMPKPRQPVDRNPNRYHQPPTKVPSEAILPTVAKPRQRADEGAVKFRSAVVGSDDDDDNLQALFANFKKAAGR